MMMFLKLVLDDLYRKVITIFFSSTSVFKLFLFVWNAIRCIQLLTRGTLYDRMGIKVLPRGFRIVKLTKIGNN